MTAPLVEAYRREAQRFLAEMGLYLHDNHLWRVEGPPIPLQRHEITAVQVLFNEEWDRIQPSIEGAIKAREAADALRKAEIEALTKEREDAEAARVAAIKALREEREKYEAVKKAEAEMLAYAAYLKSLPKPSFKNPDAQRSTEEEAKVFAEIMARQVERDRLKAEAEQRRKDRDHSRERREKDRARYFNEHMTGGLSEHHLYGPRGFKHPFKYEESPEENWATQTLFRGRVGGSLSYRPSHPLADNKALSIVTAGICGDPPKGRSALEKQTAIHG